MQLLIIIILFFQLKFSINRTCTHCELQTDEKKEFKKSQNAWSRLDKLYIYLCNIKRICIYNGYFWRVDGECFCAGVSGYTGKRYNVFYAWMILYIDNKNDLATGKYTRRVIRQSTFTFFHHSNKFILTIFFYFIYLFVSRKISFFIRFAYTFFEKKKNCPTFIDTRHPTTDNENIIPTWYVNYCKLFRKINWKSDTLGIECTLVCENIFW